MARSRVQIARYTMSTLSFATTSPGCCEVCSIGMRWCCGASSIEPAEPLTAEQPAEKQKEAEPSLTAEQLAEKKQKEAELIAAQLAEPSYWDEVGYGKPNASALKAALADTVLVSMRRGWRGSPTRAAYCRGARTCRPARG